MKKKNRMGGEKKQLHLLYRLQKLGNCVIADAPLPSLEIHFNSKPDPSEYLERSRHHVIA